MKTVVTLILGTLICTSILAQQGVSIDVEHSKKTKEAIDVNLPKKTGWVNDFEGILTKEEVKKLEKELNNFNAASGNNIVVITITDLQGYNSASDYGNAIGNAWEVWAPHNPNGIVIVFSISLKQIAVSRNEGLQDIFTREVCAGIMTQQMMPSFQTGNYYQGFIDAYKKAQSIWTK